MEKTSQVVIICICYVYLCFFSASCCLTHSFPDHVPWITKNIKIELDFILYTLGPTFGPHRVYIVSPFTINLANSSLGKRESPENASPSPPYASAYPYIEVPDCLLLCTAILNLSENMSTEPCFPLFWVVSQKKKNF